MNFHIVDVPIERTRGALVSSYGCNGDEIERARRDMVRTVQEYEQKATQNVVALKQQCLAEVTRREQLLVGVVECIDEKDQLIAELQTEHKQLEIAQNHIKELEIENVELKKKVAELQQKYEDFGVVIDQMMANLDKEIQQRKEALNKPGGSGVAEAETYIQQLKQQVEELTQTP